MICEIIRVRQDFDLKTHETRNLLVIQLSDGSTIEVPVSEDAITHVVQVSGGIEAPVPSSEPRKHDYSPPSDANDDISDFGGDYGGDDGLEYEEMLGVPSEPVQQSGREFNVIEQPRPAALPRVQPGQGPVARVMMDDRGYPVTVTDAPRDQEDEDPGAEQA